jgi:hypothetical protein
MPDPTGDNGIIRPDLLRRLRELAERINQALAPVAGWVVTIDAALEQVRPALDALAAALKQSPPRNWDLDRVDVEAGIAIVQGEGIPLAWVPDTELVVELVAASNRDDRIQLLLAHEGEVLAECRRCLDECTEAELADQVYLASRALDACAAGFREPAQALSVVVAEGVITEFVVGDPAGKVYAKAIEKIPEPDTSTILFELHRFLAMAPIRSFYTRWRAEGGGRSAIPPGAESTRDDPPGDPRALPPREQSHCGDAGDVIAS